MTARRFRAPAPSAGLLFLIALAAAGCVRPEPASTPGVPSARAEEIGAPREKARAQEVEPPAPSTDSAAPEAAPAAPARGGPRKLRDVPDHFLAIAPSGAAREPSGGTACPGQVQDPRYSAKLGLVRSRGGQGDYEVPPGRYGVGDGELLRIECGTGRAIAIVPR